MPVFILFTACFQALTWAKPRQNAAGTLGTEQSWHPENKRVPQGARGRQLAQPEE